MLEKIEHLSVTLLPLIIHLLEFLGVFIILFAALRAFVHYAKGLFDFSNENIKIEMSRSLAVALEFKLGAEILKTLLVRTLDELVILASIVILRVALTFVIHWEIESDTKLCNYKNIQVGNKRKYDDDNYNQNEKSAKIN